MVLAVTGLIFINELGTSDDLGQVAGSSQTKKADYVPLVPTEENGSKKDVKPNICTNNTKLICFEDKYLNGKLKVTQQKLEDNQKIDALKLPEIAKTSFSETSAADYEAVKTKNGDAIVISYRDIESQRAIFSSKNMLVFVESEKTYSKQQWADYFDSLKT